MLARPQTWLLLAVLVGTFEVGSCGKIWDGVRGDSSELIKAGIGAGEDINEKDPASGQSPLMAAVLGGHEEAVAVLLSAGADPSVPERDGYTPCHGAGFQGRASIMKKLIAHGLDPLDKHQDGFSPLHRACWGNMPRHTETVQALLEAGVPYDLQASNGKTCLDVTPNANTAKAIKKWKAHLSRKDEL